MIIYIYHFFLTFPNILYIFAQVNKSYRAENLNKKTGSERYNSEIVHYEPAGEGARDRILKYEKRRAEILKEELYSNIHKRP